MECFGSIRPGYWSSLINRSFLPQLWHDHSNPVVLLNWWRETKVSSTHWRYHGHICQTWWPRSARLVWSSLKYSHWFPLGHIFQRALHSRLVLRWLQGDHMALTPSSGTIFCKRGALYYQVGNDNRCRSNNMDYDEKEEFHLCRMSHQVEIPRSPKL